MKRLFVSLCCLFLLPFAQQTVSAEEQSLPELPSAERDALSLKAEPLAANIRKNNPEIKGGPGFSRETAWVFLYEDSSAVSAEYELLRLIFKRRGLSQALVVEDGRYYDVHTYSWETEAGEPCVLKVWFDITAYFHNMYGKQD